MDSFVGLSISRLWRAITRRPPVKADPMDSAVLDNGPSSASNTPTRRRIHGFSDKHVDEARASGSLQRAVWSSLAEKSSRQWTHTWENTVFSPEKKLGNVLLTTANHLQSAANHVQDSMGSGGSGYKVGAGVKTAFLLLLLVGVVGISLYGTKESVEGEWSVGGRRLQAGGGLRKGPELPKPVLRKKSLHARRYLADKLLITAQDPVPERLKQLAGSKNKALRKILINGGKGATNGLDSLTLLNLTCKDGKRLIVGPVLPESNGYLMVQLNGGLNQQRASIANAVAVAWMLNATLVLPSLRENAFWQDNSSFAEIFDVEHFTDVLSDTVRVAFQLPMPLQYIKATKIDPPADASAEYYLKEVLPVLKREQVVTLRPFTDRLSHTDVPPVTQWVRCKANFEALRLAPALEEIGRRIVQRLTLYGPFVTIHLRFEDDILAWSGCRYDVSRKEQQKFKDMRKMLGWSYREELGSPEEKRSEGQCPLTPEEIGRWLRGLGYSSHAQIYLASGKIHNEEESLAKLRTIFPNLRRKENDLMSREEMEVFGGHAFQMAALDFYVAAHSDVFVAPFPSNMADLVVGERVYTRRPGQVLVPEDRKELTRLLDDTDLSEDEFAAQVKALRKTSMSKFGPEGPVYSNPQRPDSVYSNPRKHCQCDDSSVSDM